MKSPGTPVQHADPNVGLCASCTHGRQIASARGSIFWLCERSKTDPAFPRYPRLPVLTCAGFEPAESES